MSETPARPAVDAGEPSASRTSRARRAPVEYAGEPTRAQIRRRPVWILALLVCLAVAGGFAWLGQWQMEHAIQEDTNALVDSEEARPLDSLATAGEPVNEFAAGMVVTTSGAFTSDDLVIVEQRVNGGDIGAWVVGNFTVGAEDPEAQLAVALGWAPTVEDAEAAREALRATQDLGEPATVVGRFTPPEAPQVPDAADDPHRILSMVPAQLANIWETVDAPVYAGFLVLHPGDPATSDALTTALADAGLAPIDSVAPLPPEKINWLNLFYAIEWAVFGGFAIYFWFRLTRDAWEREHELAALRASEEGDPQDTADATNITTLTQQ